MENDTSKSKRLTVIKQRKCGKKSVYRKVTEYSVETNKTLITNQNKCVHKRKQILKRSYLKHTEENYTHYSSKDRIVPICFRSKCHTLHFATKNNSNHRTQNHHQTERVVKKEKKCNSNRRHCRKHCQYNKHRLHRDVSDNLHVLLSPISLSPLKDDIHSFVSYDDISSDTISTYSTTRIDKLIKKTRERERRSLQEWPQFPKPSSNASSTDHSDIESLHSAATLVLNAQPAMNQLDVYNMPGPYIKQEILEENFNHTKTYSDYMRQDLCEGTDMSLINSIKTEVMNLEEKEYSLQPGACITDNNQSKPYLVLQSGEITTNVFSPVENFVVIKSEKTNIKPEYLSDF